MPLVAVRTATGGLRVRYGHRRALAAVEAELPTVPVYVAGVEGELDDTTTIDRVVRQFAENEHRAGLTTAEKVAVVEQLSLLGIEAGAIAKRTKLPRTTVDGALAVAASGRVRTLVDRHTALTLDQAAALAEFDDNEEVRTELLGAATAPDEHEPFEHIVQEARDERARAEAVAKRTAELTASGITVITAPSYGDMKTAPLTHLRADNSGTELDPGKHASCPGRVAWVTPNWRGVELARVTEGCQNWADHGHFGPYIRLTPTTTTTPASGTAESAAAAAERKQVIENNKAWKSAETVRREWLRTALKARVAPPGAAQFLAGEIVRSRGPLYEPSASMLAIECFDLSSTGSLAFAEAASSATDGRALVIALGWALCLYEEETGPWSWRGTDGPDAYRNAAGATKRYLTFLASWGYELSAVEKLAAGIKPGRTPTKTTRAAAPAKKTQPAPARKATKAPAKKTPATKTTAPAKATPTTAATS